MSRTMIYLKLLIDPFAVLLYDSDFKFHIRIFNMSNFNIFIMRAVLGAAFSVLMMRMFYPDAHIIYTAGLGIFMVGVAYLLESWRRRKRQP